MIPSSYTDTNQWYQADMPSNDTNQWYQAVIPRIDTKQWYQAEIPSSETKLHCRQSYDNSWSCWSSTMKNVSCFPGNHCLVLVFFQESASSSLSFETAIKALLTPAIYILYRHSAGRPHHLPRHGTSTGSPHLPLHSSHHPYAVSQALCSHTAPGHSRVVPSTAKEIRQLLRTYYRVSLN